MWTKKSAKIRKQVRGCLQNLYQSVAIHLKYVFLVGTLITSTKVFSLIIICKSLRQNDPLPRGFRLCTQRFDDPLPRNCINKQEDAYKICINR